MTKTVSYANARQICREHSGLLRTAQAIKLGIPPATLYAMRNAGVITQESRGLYRLAEAELVSNPDIVYVCQRVSKAEAVKPKKIEAKKIEAKKIVAA